jgi:hypothetical protein
MEGSDNGSAGAGVPTRSEQGLFSVVENRREPAEAGERPSATPATKLETEDLTPLTLVWVPDG